MGDALTRVAFFAPYTEHVGTAGVMLKLSAHFEEHGVSADLIRTYREWPDNRSVMGRLVDLSEGWSNVGIDRLPFPWKKFFMAATILPRLVRYLRREQPDVLITGLLPSVAVVARDISGVDVKVVASIQGLPQHDTLRSLLWPFLFSRMDGVVAPVPSIANQTADIAGLTSSDIDIIPNPVVTGDILAAGTRQPDHQWFKDDVPIIVAVGRQTRQKDFSTLLRAHAHLLDSREVRLIVPGKTDERTGDLLELRDELDLTHSVDFPGFVDNPYAYMESADVFVLSSAWEGPGHVLIEALALGTPVVSTDCPSGPREILDDGAAGVLIPVGDSETMAAEISRLLDNEELRERYSRAGRRAATQFFADPAGARYLALCKNLARPLNHAD